MRLVREIEIVSLEDDLLLQNLVLRHVVSEGSSPIQHLEENYTKRPHIDLKIGLDFGNFWRENIFKSEGLPFGRFLGLSLR